MSSPLRIVCISDTHGKHSKIKLPEGDILIHAGDMSRKGGRDELRDMDLWLASLPYRHKVLIAGNHDFGFENHPEDARAIIKHAIYLENSSIILEGIKIWGSPYQPRFFDWAFNLDRGAPLKAIWDQIPTDTDILVTHGPPYGILDQTSRGERVGCEELRAAVERIQPRAHIFGHIHEAYGTERVGSTLFVNPSTCNLHYHPVQAPIVITLSLNEKRASLA